MATKNRVVFITWKDIRNPYSGGSESVIQEISKRYIADGFEVLHLVPGFKGSQPSEIIDGIKVIRLGRSAFSFFFLPIYYLFKLKQEGDILIDEFNCFSNFSFLCGNRTRTYILLFHVQGEIWKFQKTFPFVFPLNYIGAFLEKLQLIFISKIFSGKVITISNSTKNELLSLGFSKEKIEIIPLGTDIEPVKLLDMTAKNQVFTVISVGLLRKMKRVEETVQAFEIFHNIYPDSKLIIVGNGDQYNEIKSYIIMRKLEGCIELKGYISKEEKKEIMMKAHVLVVTSVKEGWGLIVTEANSQGTPAITYNVPGLCDSNKVGILNKENTPQAVADELAKLYNDRALLERMSIAALEDSRQYSYDQTYNRWNSRL